MAIRLVHTADWHLGHPFTVFGEAAPRRQEDQKQAISRLAESAISHQVAAMLISGDLFHSSQPEPAAQEIARLVLDRVAEHDIPVYAIAGSHDSAGAADLPPAWSHPNLTWLAQPVGEKPQQIRIEDQDLWLYGFSGLPDWNTPLSSIARREFEGLHVGLLHTPVGQTKRKKSQFPSPADLADLNLDYLALGHVHNYLEIRHSERLVGCYPGTPEALHYDEAGPRTALLLEFDAGTTKIRRIEIGSAQCVDYSFEVQDHFDGSAIIERLKELSGPSVYAQIRLSGALEKPFDIDLVAEKVGSAPAYWRLIDETNLEKSAYLRDLAEEPTVRGYALNILLQRMSGIADARDHIKLMQALRRLALEFDRHPAGQIK